jgi:hypothetical protein
VHFPATRCLRPPLLPLCPTQDALCRCADSRHENACKSANMVSMSWQWQRGSRADAVAACCPGMPACSPRPLGALPSSWTKDSKAPSNRQTAARYLQLMPAWVAACTAVEPGVVGGAAVVARSSLRAA